MHSFQDSRARYLFEAVSTGSVRGAAEKLAIAPSAVSRQIALLEDELGIALVERQRTGVVPTEAGKLVLTYYREHQSHQHDMLAKMDAVRGVRTGCVNVVSGEGFAQELINGPIQQFRQRYPHVRIALEIHGTNEIMRRVKEDVAEIGLVYYAPADTRITCRGSAYQPLHAVVAPGHPLTQHSSTSLRQLSQWPVALLQGEYGIRQLVQNAELAAHTQLQPALTSNLISVLISFVTSGQGVTLLPPCAVTTEMQQGRVTAVPIDNAALLSAEVQLITRTGRQLSPAASLFLQYCNQGMQAFQTTTCKGTTPKV